MDSTSARAALLGATLALATSTSCQSGAPRYMPTADYDAPAEPGKLYRWSFDPPPTPGEGIVSSHATRTFLPTYGNWEIVQDATAPSPPNVYVPKRNDRSAREISPYGAQVEVVGVAFGDFSARVRVKVKRATKLQYAAFTGLAVTVGDSGAGFAATIRPRVGDVQEFTLLTMSANERGFEFASVVPVRTRPTPPGEWSWCTIAIEVRGSNVSARLDDDLVVGADDFVHGPGRLGLINLSLDPVAFDDLEAREIPRGEASAHHIP